MVEVSDYREELNRSMRGAALELGSIWATRLGLEGELADRFTGLYADNALAVVMRWNEEISLIPDLEQENPKGRWPEQRALLDFLIANQSVIKRPEPAGDNEQLFNPQPQ